jgi:hypothetical protein
LLVSPLVLSLVAGLATASSSRRPALSQVLRGEALAGYEAARQEFKALRYPQALAGFMRVHALSGEPRLLWNAAACLRKLERNAEALRNLESYLAQGEAQLTQEEKQEALRAQTAVQELVATVQLTIVPVDATVAVDGTPLEIAPGQGVYLEPGRHALVVTKPGFQERTRQEVLRAGETVRWKIELTPVLVAAVVPPVVPVGVKLTSETPRPGWGPWLVAGGGVAVSALGGVLLGLSGSDYARLRQECGTTCSPQRWAASRDRETAGVVLVTAGAAALVAGCGWWAFGGSDTRAQLTLAPNQLLVEGRF